MNIDFTSLVLGQSYERPFLAKLWGYQSFHAISKGVVTPANTKFILLFVTKEKQGVFPQYNDYIDGNLLFWEGEEKHNTDFRIINFAINNDEIHLFYRDIHHRPFIYFGNVMLTDYMLNDNSPSEFIFNIGPSPLESDISTEVCDHATEYKTQNKTEEAQIIVGRLGQDDFRKKLIRLWGSCSVTGLHNISLLRASHIKPWKDSNSEERLTPFNGLLLIPDYDLLFDIGYISFDNKRNILISRRLDSMARRILHVDGDLCLRKNFPESDVYFEYHRDKVFKKSQFCLH